MKCWCFRKMSLFPWSAKKIISLLDRQVMDQTATTAIPGWPGLPWVVGLPASFLLYTAFYGECTRRVWDGKLYLDLRRLDSSHRMTWGKLFVCLPGKVARGLNQYIDNSWVCLPCLFLSCPLCWSQTLFPLSNFDSIQPNPPQGWAFSQRKSKYNFINRNSVLAL